MPRVEVGNTLNFRGGKWLVDRIGRHEETSIAQKDADEFEEDLRREGNTRYESKQIENFIAGDIITIKTERISLALPGQDGYYIYTMFEVKKERSSYLKENEDARSNTEGSKAADQQPAAHEVEGPRDGIQDGEGVREASPDPASGAIHGSGSVGEGGADIHPQVSEGCEHPTANDGDSAGAGTGVNPRVQQ